MLAFLVTKYQRHVHWTHNDILKLSHPKATDPSVNMILKYITRGFDKVKEYYTSLKSQPILVPVEPKLDQTLNVVNEEIKLEPKPDQTTTTVVKEEAQLEPTPYQTTTTTVVKQEAQLEPTPELQTTTLITTTVKEETKTVETINYEILDYVYEYLEACYNIKKATEESEVIKFIEKFHFHLEHIPTKFLKCEAVWLALIEHSLPVDVILRNLNKLSNMKSFNNIESKYIDLVCEKLKKNDDSNFNLTPFALLNIWKAYEKGHSQYSKTKRWNVNQKLNLSLETAFHDSLRTGLSSKKKICVILNVWKYSRGSIYGNSNVNSLEAAIFMCLSHVFSEDNCKVYNFTDKLNEIEMSKTDSFKSLYDKIWNLNSLGSTEYIKSIESATNDSLDFDVFVVYTNLLLARNFDVNTIITNYRKKLNKPNAKLVVVSLVASLEPVCSFNDPLALDLLGFRYETPNIITNYISDKF
jgi:hypothetical protein